MYGEIEQKGREPRERNRGIGIPHGFFLRPMSGRKERQGQTSQNNISIIYKPGPVCSIK